MKRLLMHLVATLSLIVLVFACAKPSTRSKDMPPYPTMNLTITKAIFESKIGASISRMRGAAELNEADYIEMVRIYNTLVYLPDSERSTQASEFLKEFVPNHLNKAVEKLSAKLSKGMSYYSPKYDLFIGGSPHENSSFKIK